MKDSWEKRNEKQLYKIWPRTNTTKILTQCSLYLVVASLYLLMFPTVSWTTVIPPPATYSASSNAKHIYSPSQIPMTFCTIKGHRTDPLAIGTVQSLVGFFYYWNLLRDFGSFTSHLSTPDAGVVFDAAMSWSPQALAASGDRKYMWRPLCSNA